MLIKGVGRVNTQIFKLCILIKLFSPIPMVFALLKNSKYFSSNRVERIAKMAISGSKNRLKTREKWPKLHFWSVFYPKNYLTGVV